MAHESLDDVIEQIADWCNVYGACSTEVKGCSADPKCCRPGFVSELKFRILNAVRSRDAEIERLRETLEKIAAPCYGPDPSRQRRDIARAALNTEKEQ